MKNSDQKGFHFAKNSKFLMLPKNNNYDGYNSNENIEVLIDYKNNVHFIQQDQEKIDVLTIKIMCILFNKIKKKSTCIETNYNIYIF